MQEEAKEKSLTEDITAPDAKRRNLIFLGNTSTSNVSHGGNLAASEIKYAYSASGNTNAMCRFGYEGPMCNKCINGYWKTPADTCERCKTSEEDSQRGDRDLQLMVYVGGKFFFCTFFLF